MTLFAVALTVVLFTWYRVEGTLSIHSIVTPRREIFYWLTVCCTFALGTATGDLTATTLHLGYFTSACCSRWRSSCRWWRGGSG